MGAARAGEGDRPAAPQAAGETRVLLQGRRLVRRFGSHTALALVDVEVRAGEVVALVGPNGAGKSTLLAILAGALRPSEGSVVAGDPRPRVGWVPQRPAQYGHLTPRENVELFARLEGMSGPAAQAERILREVGLEAEARRASQLSVGNQQRLNLAIGLLGDPDVLLLDEPTASLDPKGRRRLWEIVEQARRNAGGIVFATHDLAEARRVADRLLVLLDGRITFAGAPAEEDGRLAEVFE